MKLVINNFKMPEKAKRIILFGDGHTEEHEVPVEYLTLSEYNIKQIDWIENHKYFLSREKGYEVSFNEAAFSWVRTGLAEYFRKQFKIKGDR